MSFLNEFLFNIDYKIQMLAFNNYFFFITARKNSLSLKNEQKGVLV